MSVPRELSILISERAYQFYLGRAQALGWSACELIERFVDSIALLQSGAAIDTPARYMTAAELEYFATLEFESEGE
ncbi:MAG TPA: hypothetical protein VKE42_02075 [Candidatus Cybelea sp.]|nr:hypothetical protein [Candidatus Cybelea sp.]